MKNDAGDPIAMTHTSFHIENKVKLAGLPEATTEPGLTTLLVDESFTVTGATTVENL